MAAMLKQVQGSSNISLSNEQVELRELLEIIEVRSFRRGHFTLASGKESDHYFDMKATIMHGRGNLLAARAFLRRARAESADFIGGLAMGAVPIMSSVALLSELDGSAIDSIFVRPKPKEHGTKRKVEGLVEGQSIVGKRVVMADDVTTSGGSVFEAIQAVRDAGAIVKTAISLVDRLEGAEQFLAERGVRLVPIFTARDFGV